MCAGGAKEKVVTLRQKITETKLYFCRVYRTLVAIVLLFSLSFQLFVKLAVVVWYQVNKAYIAQNLCENRDKPELKCCGKCVLKKKLTATEGSNAAGRELSTRFQLGELPAYVLPSSFAVMLTQCPPDAAMQVGRVANWVEMTFVNQCFRPPSA